MNYDQRADLLETRTRMVSALLNTLVVAMEEEEFPIGMIGETIAASIVLLDVAKVDSIV